MRTPLTGHRPIGQAVLSVALRQLCQPGASRRRAAEAVARMAAALASQIRPVVPLRELTLVPVLRAGAAMLPAASEVLDYPQVCFVRCSKDKTNRDVHVTWGSAGRIDAGSAVILDVVVARGDTITALLADLRERGYTGPAHLLTCYAAPEGIEHILDRDPQVRVYVGGVADTVDPAGYLVPPTYGDIGTKLFGAVDTAD